MTTPTTGSRKGGSGRDFAVTAALSARAYVPRTAAMAQQASNRVADRWAPETGVVNRSRSLRSLAFADQLMSPYIANAQQQARNTYNFSRAGEGAAQTNVMSPPQVNWLFPTPWYQDELNWLAAARASVEQTAVMASQPYRTVQQPGQPTPRPTLATRQFDQARLAYVAPGFSDTGLYSGSTGSHAPAQRMTHKVITPQVARATALKSADSGSQAASPLRAWSPLVPFKAAQAAELMSSVLADADRDGSRRALATTAAAPLFHYVAPAQLAATSGQRRSTVSSRSQAPQSIVPVAGVVGKATRARLAASHVVRQVIVPPAFAPTPATSSSSATATTPSMTSSAPTAQTASAPPTAMASAPPPVTVTTPAATTTAATTTPPDVRLTSSPSARAIELLTESILAATVTPAVRPTKVGAASTHHPEAASSSATETSVPRRQLAPSAGPRVALPAGMGGLVVGLDAVQSVNRPLVQAMPSVTAARRVAHTFSSQPPQVRADAAQFPVGSAAEFSPISASPVSVNQLGQFTPAPAYVALAQARPAALTHVAWADRWLARFAGASPAALTAMTASTPTSALASHLMSPAPVYLRSLDADTSNVAQQGAFSTPFSTALSGFQSTISGAAAAASAMSSVVVPPASQAVSSSQRVPAGQTVVTPQDLQRAPVLDDDEPVPDEVFRQISAASVPRLRHTSVVPAAPVATSAAAMATRPASPPIADQVVRAAPSAPGAGLHAGLASSPLAPLLRGLLALPTVGAAGPAALFDVRALSPAAVASAFLSGFVPPTMSLVVPSVSSASVSSASGPSASGASASGVGSAKEASASLASQTFTAPPIATPPVAIDGSHPSEIGPRSAIALSMLVPQPPLLANANIMASPASPLAPTSGPSRIAAQRDLITPDLGRPVPPTRVLSGDMATSASGRAPYLRPLVPAAVAAAAFTAIPQVIDLHSSAGSPFAQTLAAGSPFTQTSFMETLGAETSSTQTLGAGESLTATSLPGTAIGTATAESFATQTSLATSPFDGLPEAQTAQPLMAYTASGQLVSARTLVESSPSYSLATASPTMTQLAMRPTPGVAATSRELAHTWSGRPGDTATVAQTWSAEQETATTDLALDFVAPELIIAAQQYGFSPMQAVQASHLAASGPAGIQAMAAAVDMTFLNSLAAHQQGAQPSAMQAAIAAPYNYYEPIDVEATPPAPARPTQQAGAVFGAAARAPRGAFLWPASTVESLGLVSAEAEQSQPHALAALDLLAANTVAEAGVYAQPWTDSVETPPPELARHSTAMTDAATSVDPDMGFAQHGTQLPPAFQSIYLALSETPAGRSLSPTVRAARALALAEQSSHTDMAHTSARTRAAAAWAVLPVVMSAPLSTSTQQSAISSQSVAAEPVRTGTPSLPTIVPAQAAGESLRSLVAPQDAGGTSISSTSSSSVGAVLRAPTAAPELVRTGASSEQAAAITMQQRVADAVSDTSNDLPSWFEAAAKRIIAEGAADDGISLAEMTLISTTPALQVAAATQGASTPPPTPPPAGAEAGAAAPVVNVEALAEDVYAEVVRMLNIQRERNGDPWQN